MIAILTTHPIQYQVPLWQALARDGRVPFEVWYLTNHGIEVSKDQEFGREFAWDIDTLDGYPYRFVKTAPGASPTSFWKCRLVEPLEDLIRTRGAKVLWVQGWQVAAYWQAVWAAKRAGAEVWLRGESNDLAPTMFWKERAKALLLGEFFKRVDRFLFIGTANRRLYERYGVSISKLHSSPYAVDNERFRQQAERLRPRRSELRAQWGISEDAFCVLFCGKFIPKKRPLDVIAGARRLGKRAGTNKPHLLFVGSGELGQKLREECNVVFDAENGGLLDNQSCDLPNASFAGFLNQTEISQAYVAADCLVLPSDYGETWGLVVNEALMSDLPCVVSDACGCAEDLVKPFVPEMCFQLGEQRELAAALETAAKRRAHARHFEVIGQKYDFVSSVQTIAQIYPS